MIDFNNRRILGFSCATQFASLMTFTIIQNSLGYEFCLENRSCVVSSVKILLANLSLSVTAGWISSGAFVVENESNSSRTNTKRKVSEEAGGITLKINFEVSIVAKSSHSAGDSSISTLSPADLQQWQYVAKSLAFVSF